MPGAEHAPGGRLRGRVGRVGRAVQPFGPERLAGTAVLGWLVQAVTGLLLLAATVPGLPAGWPVRAGWTLGPAILVACLYRPGSVAPTLAAAAALVVLVAVPRSGPGAAAIGLLCTLFLLGADARTSRAAVRAEVWLPARLRLLAGALGFGLLGALAAGAAGRPAWWLALVAAGAVAGTFAIVLWPLLGHRDGE